MGGADLGVAEEAADHFQRCTPGDQQGCEGVAQVTATPARPKPMMGRMKAASSSSRSSALSQCSIAARAVVMSLNWPSQPISPARSVRTRLGAVLELDAKPVRTETMHEIRELHIARRALNKDRTACRNRLEAARNKVVLAQLRARLRQVDSQLEQIDTELARLIAEEPALARRQEILCSIPGIGAVTAVAMVVEMPELGTMESKEAASLSGLAPITRESGKWKGRSKIGGGRRGMRNALYMPALVAIRHNLHLAETYRKLVDAGKPAKLAIAAIMRKLVILANALIRDDREWTKTAP